MAARKQDQSVRRQRRTRTRIRAGGSGRCRLTVHCSLKNVYAQVIDDAAGRTLAAASTLEPELGLRGKCNREAASRVGALVADRARQAGVEQVVFDRGGRRYHGRVRALADAARESGLDF